MPALSALIFDVDGTLAETEELHREAFNAAFAAAGLDWHWDQGLYAELLEVSGGKERIAHYQRRTGIAPALDSAAIAALHADKTARYTARIRAGSLALRPGIRRILAEAKVARLRLAIATTTSHPNVQALLAAAAPLPAFDVIAAGDDVPAKKPAPISTGWPWKSSACQPRNAWRSRTRRTDWPAPQAPGCAAWSRSAPTAARDHSPGRRRWCPTWAIRTAGGCVVRTDAAGRCREPDVAGVTGCGRMMHGA